MNNIIFLLGLALVGYSYVSQAPYPVTQDAKKDIHETSTRSHDERLAILEANQKSMLDAKFNENRLMTAIQGLTENHTVRIRALEANADRIHETVVCPKSRK